LRWKFLAAAADRRLVNSGQVESVWPVMNAVFHKGLVWCAAGLQLDLDNGIFVWGLDPVTGEIKGRTRLFNPPVEGQGAPRDDIIKVAIKPPFSHVFGGGFAAQVLAVHEDQLVAGYRRWGISTSAAPLTESPNGWVYARIDLSTPGPQRFDRTVLEKLIRVFDVPRDTDSDFAFPGIKPKKNQK
jgi:hypothetical protein